MEDRLAVVVSETGLQGPNAESLLLAFRPFFGKAQALVEAAAAINVTDATQVTEMKNARASRLALRAVRVEVEAARKTMKEDSLRTGRAIDGMANVLKFLIEPAENRLEEMEKFAERKEAERKAALKSGREDLLRPFGIDTSAYMLGEMKQETFAELLNATRVAHEAKVAAAQKAEVERIAAEAARTAEEKRVRDENERLRQEAVAAEAARKAEREKLEAEARKEREKAEAERRAAEAKAAAERAAADKKLAEERAAREKLERDAAAARAKEEAARKAQIAAEKKAARAPDKDKFLAVAAAVRGITIPAVSSLEAVAVRETIVQKTEAFAAWIETQANAL